MFEWNPWALPSFTATLLAAATAILVYVARPWRAQNQLLALAIALGGLSAGLYFGLRLVLVQPSHAWLAAGAGIMVLIASPLPYLLFLSTLETPLVRHLRRRRFQIGLVLAVLCLEAVWLTQPRLVLPAVEPFRYINGWNIVGGPLIFPVALLPLLLAELFGFVVAISAFRHARTPIARAQARAYAVAFGTRDLLGAAFIITFGGLRLNSTPLGEPIFSVGIAVIDALFFLALGYAILQYQLFNIHITIKWTIRQSTVGAAFAGAFFLGSEGVEQILDVDGTLAGIAVAAAVSLALRPLQRLAGRVANAAMPRVSASSAEYITARKAELYRAALEGGYADGEITANERMMLHRLRAQLEIPAADAARLEAEVRQVLARPDTAGSAAAIQAAT